VMVTWLPWIPDQAGRGVLQFAALCLCKLGGTI
jgi:hypothetical protein